MLKKTISYTDYNGDTRTEDFYFNLTKAELMELELSETGGFTTMVSKIISSQDVPTMMRIFKEFILKSYGEKSADGKRFKKSKELSDAFSQTEAYSSLFMELVSDADAAGKFFNGIVPADVALSADSKLPDNIPDNIKAAITHTS